MQVYQRAGHFIVDMRGWRQELCLSCHANNSALLSCLTPWPNPPELLSGSSWTMASSAEEQSITPVPFRDWGHWLRGLVQNHYLLKLLLPEVQVELNLTWCAAVVTNSPKTEDSSSSPWAS